MSTRTKPVLLASHSVDHSRLFHVEQQHLRFSNGEERVFERLNPGIPGAVMIVAVAADGRLVLVREYGAGVADYYLSFPKGAQHGSETVLEAANRELKEEVGFGARHLEVISELLLSPSYMGNRMSIVLATDLYEEKLEGDEPEPLEVSLHTLDELMALRARGELSESNAVAALFIVRDHLRQSA